MYAESQKNADEFFNAISVQPTDAEVKSLKEHDLWPFEKPEYYSVSGAMEDRGRLKKTENGWLWLEQHGAFYELYDYGLDPDQFDKLLEAIDDYLRDQESFNVLNYLD